jgi:hypothetical protein
MSHALLRAYLSAIVAGLVACSLAGCSTGAVTTEDPPLDPAKVLSSLSTSDLQALCDWEAQEQGGYGTTLYCEASGVPLYTATSQAECVAEVKPNFGRATCTATVGQLTTCVKWFVANWCSSTPPALPSECIAFDNGCYGTQLTPDGGTD